MSFFSSSTNTNVFTVEGTLKKTAGTRQSLWARSFRVGLLPLPLLLACVGSIDPLAPGGVGKTNDPSNPNPNNPVNPTEPPPRQPDSAPTTGFIASAPGTSSRFMRLSHTQWENTVRDLFKMSASPGLSNTFVNEGLRSHFDNQGGDLEVSAQLAGDYNSAANSLATRIVRDAKALEAVLPATAATGADLDGRARTFIKAFGERAYRRPITDAEVEQYVTLFRKGPALVGSGDAFLDGLELVVALFLQSPHFLYRMELGTEVKNGRIVLSDYEVASRLSYGLVRTMPDAPLFAAAANKKLRTKEEVLEHAKRLLDTPAGRDTLKDMHTQLMRETDPTELVRDTKLHPNFKPGIGVDMKKDALAFVDDIIFGKSQGVTELLTAPYAFVTAKTAPLYGAKMPAGAGTEPVRVDLDPTQRAGLYTQAGFLAMTATDFSPRPIKRGVTISEDVLCTKVPPPPPEVNNPTAPQLEGKTNRQNFEAATEMPGTLCIGCHQTFINPLGFAFENYDGLGGFRKDEKGLPIDAKGKFAFEEGEKTFDGAVELMKLMAEGRQAHECYSERLFEYVYGRAETGPEAGLVQELGRRSRKRVPIKNLVLDLVATDAFLTRAP